MRSLLAGFDVSPKRLGWALVDLVSGEPVACGCEAIELPKNGWDRKRVHDALWAIDKQIVRMGLPVTAEVEAAYAEHPISRFPGMAYDEGRAVGMVHAEVQRRWPHAPVEYLLPEEWKKLAEVPPKASVNRARLIDLGVPRPHPKADSIKPHVYLRAWELGFHANGHQDAADAACIAVAGQKRNDETWTRAVERRETGEAA